MDPLEQYLEQGLLTVWTSGAVPKVGLETLHVDFFPTTGQGGQAPFFFMTYGAEISVTGNHIDFLLRTSASDFWTSLGENGKWRVGGSFLL